jgi:hypothetical protein
MPTPTSSRTHSKRAVAKIAKKSVRAKSTRAKPAVRRRPKAARARHSAPKWAAGSAATEALKRFATLLKAVRSSAATLSDGQRALLKRAIKHAHAVLD